ncbi:MAG: hypothetical protein ACI8QS_002258 [Planctomycetota bacterium]|jgi:hypothetical protein
MNRPATADSICRSPHQIRLHLVRPIDAHSEHLEGRALARITLRVHFAASLPQASENPRDPKPSSESWAPRHIQSPEIIAPETDQASVFPSHPGGLVV